MAADYWDQAESLSRDEMARLQSDRLVACVRRVYDRVPFYRSKVDELGIGPDSIRSLADLTRLPFTVKQDLRDHYPFGLLAVPMAEVVRLHASSGTTGKPTVVGYTAGDIATWADLAARSLRMADVNKTDIVQNAYGYGLFTGGLGLHYGVERLGATVVPASVGNTQRQVLLMRDLGATVLCSTPSYALFLAEQAASEGFDVAASPLRAGIFGAEPWSEGMRDEIEARLGLAALNIYGLSEVMGPAVAMECAQQQGMHLAEDHFIPEIVDPDSGEPLADGELGELVFTCVTKEALPLLRYRTRDLTSLDRDPCPCGRTTARMGRVLARTDDMLIIRGVNVFPSQIESVLLGLGQVEPHYQLVVDRGDNHLDSLEVRVETTAELQGDPEAGVSLKRRLATGLQSVLGLGCAVTLTGPGGIPRSEGKAVRVIDNRTV